MKNHLQKLAARAAGWLPDALMTAGAAAISYGAGQIYAPAGWIVAGVLTLAAGWQLARSEA
jgi:hypothetical protein